MRERRKKMALFYAALWDLFLLFVFWYALVAVLFVFRDAGAYEQSARLQQLFNNRFGPDPSSFVSRDPCPDPTCGERYIVEGEVGNESIPVFDEVTYMYWKYFVNKQSCIGNE